MTERTNIQTLTGPSALCARVVPNDPGGLTVHFVTIGGQIVARVSPDHLYDSFGDRFDYAALQSKGE